LTGENSVIVKIVSGENSLTGENSVFVKIVGLVKIVLL
jgi:hypothetical protein